MLTPGAKKRAHEIIRKWIEIPGYTREQVFSEIVMEIERAYTEGLDEGYRSIKTSYEFSMV